MEGYLEKLRRAELECVKDYFKPGMRVLEIGGGSGYQASILASWGCNVCSLDLPNRPFMQKRFYHVFDYDGKNIPFEAEEFDIVFSSNVLEHIADLHSVLTEIQRVLKPESTAIHILPSSTWRFWTSTSHYLYLLKHLVGKKHLISSLEKQPSLKEKAAERGRLYVIKRLLLAGPHGEYPNAFSELYYFSKPRWLKVFKSNGFKVIEVKGNHLFYTGYQLFPDLSLRQREFMARVIGNACNVFVMKGTASIGSKL